MQAIASYSESGISGSLLDDLRLIGSEILAPPIAVTFEHSSTIKPKGLGDKAISQQATNSAILENSTAIVHGSMIGSYRWQKTVENSCLFPTEVEVKNLTLSE